jgi:aryl sulfotransferase
MRKVHDRFWCTATGKPVFPAAVSQSAIYLIRDPRDIAVSFAHHRGRDADWAIDFMADEMTVLAGDDDLMKAQLPQPLGSWSTHASSWHDQDDVPFMTVRYEDLLSEPVHHLTMIAAQLRIPIDPAAAASAVADTRFDVLQEQELADGFVERRRGSSALFFREGRAGGWQAHLTPSQAGRIVDRHREVMVRFGYV